MPRRRVIVETGLLRDWFSISSSITFAAASARVPLTLSVPQDADFVLVKLMADSGDAAPVQGGALVNIIDQGSQRSLADAQVPLSTLFGTAQRPFILPMVHRFPRAGTIILDVTNTGAAAQRINFVLSGYKIFMEPQRL